ncbi:GNAT family N-acetyltransferase [Catellatospora sp. KI3]|uniref:GNAT family N-acetyltransferase n=1 Tax=Catellatospora sp. KI3 TaxID=3041620 RepID=UPI002483261A|nr:GNAT family N-acetyltransferase [Catellatospora sp. KI3]MDI1461983.1 GNAT family N-acetyltransferase [Catellatospora sp. KI3]
MALWRVRATVDDRPGFLAVLTASLALRSVNILAVQVLTTESGAVDDLVVDTPDAMTEAELLAAIERGRGRDAWVSRTDAYGLIDPPTQALTLAARLAADPESLPAALTSLLGGSLVRREQGGATASGHSDSTMRLPDPCSDGGSLVATRLAPAFTPAEFARAQALVEVCRAALTRRLAAATMLLPDGTEVALRPAGAHDLAAVDDMHGRCGERSLYLRYLCGTRGPGRSRLARLLTPARGCTMVAETAGAAGRPHVVAVASLIGEGETAEIALLVEDGWQRRGIGTALLRRLVGLAGPSGFRSVTLHTHADNDAMLRTMRRLPDPSRLDRDGTLLSATIPVSEFAVLR